MSTLAEAAIGLPVRTQINAVKRLFILVQVMAIFLKYIHFFLSNPQAMEDTIINEHEDLVRTYK